MQYQHVLLRTRKDLLYRKHRVKRLEIELRAASSLHQSLLREFGSIQGQYALSTRELGLTDQHVATMKETYQETRERLARKLANTHADMDEELGRAKEEKAKQITTRNQIQRLKLWLERQKATRRVLHLHMGLEELGTRRLDKVLQTITEGLGADSIEDALSQYTATMVKNHSLVQEAEYKLQQQATFEVKLSALISELTTLKQDFALQFPRSWRIRKEKNDIYYIRELAKVSLAKIGLEEAERRRAQKQLETTEMLVQLRCLFESFKKADPRDMSSSPFDSLTSPSDITACFLVLEKKVQFFRVVTEQRIVWRNPHRPGRVVDAMKLLYLKTANRKSVGENVRKISEIYRCHFTSPTAHDEYIKVKTKAHTLIRSATAVEQSVAMGLAPTHSKVQVDREDDGNTWAQARDFDFDQPLITKTEETPRTAQQCIPSHKQLRKDLAYLQTASKRMLRASPAPRLADFMFALRTNEHKVVRLTGARNRPLSLPEVPKMRISTRSIGSTRAETRVSGRSARVHKSSGRITIG